MAGALTRLHYDTQTEWERNLRQANLLCRQLDSHFSVNKTRCFSPYASSRQQPTQPIHSKSQVDIESTIRGFNKIHSKSNTHQVPDPLDEFLTEVLDNCPDGLETEYTRYTYPAYEIKGLTVSDMRLDYPLKDPQCQIFESFASNTRLQARDSFRADYQEPLDQSQALPNYRGRY
jgi:hypothetical protein